MIKKSKPGQKPIRPEHQFWRKRIEGQLRHTIHEHPEWFNLPTEEVRDRCIRSTAKRIIGEIVAGTRSGNDPSGGAIRRASDLEKVTVQSRSAASRGSGGNCTAAPLVQTSKDSHSAP